MAKRIPGRLFVRNLVQKRGLVAQLVRRDFEQRFVGSAMGWLWGLIHPLAQLLSWTFLFQFVMHVRVPAGEPTRSYPLFLFAGMLPWFLFSDTVQRSASSILDQANVITKTVFPAEIVPISVFLSCLVSHVLAIVLLIAAAGVFLNQISIFLVLLPAYILVLGMFAVGLGWVVASLQVFLRDTAQALTILLTFWFFATPVMLAESQYPKWAGALLAVNPLTYLVRAYRDVMLSSRMPDLSDLFVAAAYGAVSLIVGGLFFRRVKRGFADVL
ncbi:MAG: ABC transporter permease [Acidobacteriia bacterium]|nr:ABC transporter permease [Terriglobia bacterium]